MEQKNILELKNLCKEFPLKKGLFEESLEGSTEYFFGFEIW